jgi:hypothetical protein
VLTLSRVTGAANAATAESNPRWMNEHGMKLFFCIALISIFNSQRTEASRRDRKAAGTLFWGKSVPATNNRSIP